MKESYGTYHTIFKCYDDILESLKDSKDYRFYCDKVDVLKLEDKNYFLQWEGTNIDSWSKKYPKPTLDSLKGDFENLYNKLIKHNELELLFDLVIDYTQFVSNRLKMKLDAINLFLKTIPFFESNSNYKREEIELKMHMLQLHCGKIFIIKHEEIAKDNFDTIESYFQKRFNKSK